MAHHLLKREAYFQVHSHRPPSVNKRLHLKTGAPHHLAYKLGLRRRMGPYWQDRPTTNAMPLVVKAKMGRIK
jgi:hypothetical protein